MGKKCYFAFLFPFWSETSHSLIHSRKKKKGKESEAKKAKGFLWEREKDIEKVLKGVLKKE